MTAASARTPRAHRDCVAGPKRRYLRVEACCRVLALDVPGVGDQPFHPVISVEPGAADPHLQQPRPHPLWWRVHRDDAGCSAPAGAACGRRQGEPRWPPRPSRPSATSWAATASTRPPRRRGHRPPASRASRGCSPQPPLSGPGAASTARSACSWPQRPARRPAPHRPRTANGQVARSGWSPGDRDRRPGEIGAATTLRAVREDGRPGHLLSCDGPCGCPGSETGVTRPPLRYPAR